MVPPLHVLLRLLDDDPPAIRNARFMRYLILLAVAPLTGSLLLVLFSMPAKGLEFLGVAPLIMMIAAYLFGAWSLGAAFLSALVYYGLKLAIKPRIAIIGAIAAIAWLAPFVFLAARHHASAS